MRVLSLEVHPKVHYKCSRKYGFGKWNSGSEDAAAKEASSLEISHARNFCVHLAFPLQRPPIVLLPLRLLGGD
jgi:hypothetical protein